LRQKNLTIRDHLNTKGVDAYLDTPDGRIGIEVTTLTAFFAEWVFIERLAEFCWQDERLTGQGFDITYSYKHIQICTQGNTIYDYVKRVGKAIATYDKEALANLQVTVKFIDNHPGYFSWSIEDADTYPWYDTLTSDLTQKLQGKRKAGELSNCERNLVFVGINYVSPTNWALPRLFGYLEPRESYSPYKSTVGALESYWIEMLPTLHNLIGICYFVYDLRQEDPFYPLRIFWRSEADRT
jgi:hypothetical protein